VDGSTTNEFDEYKFVCRHVRELYGDRPAAEFGSLALKANRQKSIAAGWCREFINQRVGRVRRIFKWAASGELVPATLYQALATVTGLQRGRTAAREPEAVGPVDDAPVDATLPFLNRHVRGLVEFQRLTTANTYRRSLPSRVPTSGRWPLTPSVAVHVGTIGNRASSWLNRTSSPAAALPQGGQILPGLGLLDRVAPVVAVGRPIQADVDPQTEPRYGAAGRTIFR
jgi:hypothetical protein